MTIAKLELTNFRCVASAALDLHPRLTFCCGPNASGKSSIVDGLLWSLIGSCRGTDLRGAGSKALIKTGEKAMLVRATFADGTYAQRSLRTTGTAIADPVDPIIPREIARCLVSGETFLDLAHTDAKNLLLGVLDVHVDYEDERLTLDQLDARYRVAYDARRDAKAVLNSIHVPEPPTGEVPDIERMEKQLAKLRVDERKLLASESRAGGKRGQLDKQIQKATEALAKAMAALDCHPSLTVVEAQIAALDARPDVPDDSAACARMEREKEDLLKKQGAGMEALRSLKQRDANGPTVCVLSKMVPCHTTPDEFSGVVSALHADNAVYTTRLKEINASLAEMSAAAAELATRKQTRAALATDKTRAELLIAVAVEAENEQVALTAELAAMPADSGPSAALVTIQQRIAKGEQLIRDAREIVRVRIAHEDAIAAQRSAAEKLAESERACEALGPNGVRVAALQTSVGEFTISINDALRQFGYELAFEVDPWDVVVNGRSAALLSTSERLRVGLCFSLALARVTGVNFVAIDGADLLDQAGRETLSELMLSEQVVQVLVATTREEPMESCDEFAAYWMDKGTVART